MSPSSTVTLRTGNAMPVLGLGTWQLTRDTVNTVAYAIEVGYRLIDTSSDYGSQPGVGEAIKKSAIDRDELFITTKVEETDNAYEATIEYLEELSLDYANLMIIHRPPVSGAGEELWEGLIQAKRQGLAKDIGVSNYPIDLVEELIEATGEVPAVNQIEWSPFGHSDEMMDYCHSNDIIIQAYSPLTRGGRLQNKTLTQLAGAHGKTPAQILIRWNIQLGTVPLVKANTPKHLEENLDVFDFELSKRDMDLLAALNEEYSTFGSLPYA